MHFLAPNLSTRPPTAMLTAVFTTPLTSRIAP